MPLVNDGVSLLVSSGSYIYILDYSPQSGWIEHRVNRYGSGSNAGFEPNRLSGLIYRDGNEVATIYASSNSRLQLAKLATNGGPAQQAEALVSSMQRFNAYSNAGAVVAIPGQGLFTWGANYYVWNGSTSTQTTATDGAIIRPTYSQQWE